MGGGVGNYFFKKMIKVLSQVLDFSPLFVVSAILIWAVFAYWKKWNLWVLIGVMIGYDVLLALVKSVLQYQMWEQGLMTRSLLNLPVAKSIPGWFVHLPIFTSYVHGYYLFYIWNNFWKITIFSLLAAFVIYGLFVWLRCYKQRLCQPREIQLVFLLALLVGWPQVILFLPIIFLVALIFSLSKFLLKKPADCGLAWPLLIGTALMLIFSIQISNWLFLLIKI
jgi:hypothetical protein